MDKSLQNSMEQLQNAFHIMVQRITDSLEKDEWIVPSMRASYPSMIATLVELTLKFHQIKTDQHGLFSAPVSEDAPPSLSESDLSLFNAFLARLPGLESSKSE